MINEKENTKTKYCFLSKHGKHEKVEVGVLFDFLLTPDLLSVTKFRKHDVIVYNFIW